MVDIIRIATNYHLRLKNELAKVDQFLRMAEELAKEDDLLPIAQSAVDTNSAQIRNAYYVGEDYLDLILQPTQ